MLKINQKVLRSEPLPKKINLEILIDEKNEQISIETEFSDKEVELLEKFLIEAEEVWQTDFIQKEEKGRLNIQGNEKGIIQINTVLPKWDYVIVFLHKFRPILLTNEETNFYKIHNFLKRKINHPYFTNILALEHRLFSGKKFKSTVQIKSNGVTLNSEDVLFNWLNAFEYHREEEKKKVIESLHQILPLDASKVIFLSFLIDKAKATINLADIIRVLLGKDKELEVRMMNSQS